MDKKLRLSIKGTIRLAVVFAIILWMWSFFRSYLLFLMLLLMTAGVVVSAVSLWSVRDRIQAETVLPLYRIGKNTDIPCEIRFVNPLRFAGFAIDVTYRWGNLFTGSMEEKKEKLWAAPGKGGRIPFLLNSRFAGRLRVSVETFRVYDFLKLFYLTYQAKKASEVLAWPVFSDGQDTESFMSVSKGFPRRTRTGSGERSFSRTMRSGSILQGMRLKAFIGNCRRNRGN